MRKIWLGILTAMCLCVMMAFVSCFDSGNTSEQTSEQGSESIVETVPESDSESESESQVTPATYTVTVTVNESGYGTVSTTMVENVTENTAIAVDSNKLTIGETEITATASEQTAEYTYAFTSWDAAQTVDGNITVTAIFSRATRQYTITFEMGEGTAIEPRVTNYGTPAGALDSIEVTPPAHYHFVKWMLKLDNNEYVEILENSIVDRDLIVKAIYEIDTYTVSISVAEASTGYGSVSTATLENVPYGAAITADGNKITVNGNEVTATPTASTAQYEYAFASWTAAETVTGNTNVVANFTQTLKNYTVTFEVAEASTGYGSVSTATLENVPYGAAIAANGNKITVNGNEVTATPTATTAQYEYAFASWTAAETVTGNTNVVANFTQTLRQYTITFEMGEGTAIDPETVDYGTPASALSTLQVTPPAHYHFVKWMLKAGNEYVDIPANATVEEDITVKAIYEIDSFTVTFKNYDDSVLQTGTLAYGETPAYAGETPVKPDDENYSYTFDAWSPAIAAVSADATYVATYTSQELNMIKVAEYSAKSFIGDDITVPSASIVGKVSGNLVTNEGISATATFKGEAVDITSGSYLPVDAGYFVVTYSADGLANATATINVDNKVVLVNNENVISKTSYSTHYGNSYSIGNVSGAQYTSESASCIQLNCPSEESSYLTFNIEVGDVSGYASLEIEFWALQTAGGNWHLKAGSNTGTSLFDGTGWRGWDNPVKLTNISTAYVSNGNLKLTLQQDYYNTIELYIREIKGVVVPRFTESISSAMVGQNLNPTVNCMILDKVLGENITATSAEFDGKAVSLPFIPTKPGTLVLTYEYKGLNKVCEVTILNTVTLVNTKNLIGSTEFQGGKGTIGNVSDAQLNSESSYCIKLDTSWASYNLTIAIYVGDLSRYDHLEMKFWALGLQGDTYNIKSHAGDVLFTGSGWTHTYTNPKTLTLSKSLVENGYLWLTLEETWMIGDEFYIQEIRGVIVPEFSDVISSAYIGSEVNPTASYMVDNTVVASGLTAVSATFGGEPVTLPFTPTQAGTLAVTYEYDGLSKTFNVSIIDRTVTLVTSSTLISATSSQGGAGTIGNVSGAQLGSESSYCIKLDTSWTSYSLTIAIWVGDVSKYDHLEIEFWALGLDGDTYNIKSHAGTVLYTASGWTHTYTNPKTLTLSKSLVENGYLWLTLEETWMIGDEFYIQSIKGVY